MADVKINRSLLTRELVATPRNKKASMRIVKDAVEDIINEARVDFLVELENHPVSKEISAGPKASNTTGSLGYGNLYTFIGFKAGTRPIEYLKSFFLKKSGVTKVTLQSASRGRFIVDTNIPSKAEIYGDKETHLRWEPGRSWLDGIEKGISGLGQYILARGQADRVASLKTGGSGEAIQLKPASEVKLRAGKYKPMAYFTELYNRYLKRLVSKKR
jgi:hypothetical protein